ncbi:unnamed protein product, partial [Tenebrio molitor]
GKRKVWGPGGKTYLSNKKRTLPSSVAFFDHFKSGKPHPITGKLIFSFARFH